MEQLTGASAGTFLPAVRPPSLRMPEEGMLILNASTKPRKFKEALDLLGKERQELD